MITDDKFTDPIAAPAPGSGVPHPDTTPALEAANLAAAPAPGGTGSAAVVARGFGFSYPDGTEVLCDLDWTVPAGAFVLLTGRTGCGKTTLLRSLKPEVAPRGTRSGVLEVLGTDAASMDEVFSAGSVGYVAQDPGTQMVCDEVWHELAFGLENMGVPTAVMRRRVAEVARFFGIEGWMHRKVAELSGGQMQLLALASVLVMQPRLLVLDEPTSQLDPVAAKGFCHALFRVNRELGITVIVATHTPGQMRAYATDEFHLPASEVGEGGGLPDPEKTAIPVVPAASLAPAARLTVGRRPSGALRPCAPATSGCAGVELRDVHCRYGRGLPWVLRGADLRVRSGAIHGLVGGNGSGKTTLLQVIAGVMKVERGKVVNPLRGSQVLLSQDPQILLACDSVADELREWQASAGYADADVDAMADLMGLGGNLGKHPLDLSGGQRQLLALAKLLLCAPRLLLLDEPTKGLDLPARRLVARVLADAADQGATIVVSTHDLAFTYAVADEVSMLFDGEVTCTEPAGEFFEGNIFMRVDPEELAALGGRR